MKNNRKFFINLYEALKRLKNTKGTKVAFTIVKNIKLIDPVYEKMKKFMEQPEETEAYTKERIALCELHSEKDENGKPLHEGDSFKIADEEAFNKDMEVLKEKYKDLFEKFENKKKELTEFLEEEIELPLIFIEESLLDKEMTVQEVEAIYPIIKE